MDAVQRNTRRAVRAALIVALAATFSSLAATVDASSYDSGAESEFVARINAERRERGIPELSVRSDLTAVARRHTDRMVKRGGIYHNPNLGGDVPGNWTLAGENVGVGGDVLGLHRAFMNSSSHRKNILLRGFNEVGIGVVEEDGRMWVTEVFAKRQPAQTVTVSAPKRQAPRATPVAHRRASRPAATPAAPEPKPEPRAVDMLERLIAFDA